MKRESDGSLAGLELRDILLDLVPGAVVLFSILLLPWFKIPFSSELNGFTASLAAILAAYSLGHAVYPVSYRIRRFLCKHFGGPVNVNPDATEIRYIRAAEDHEVAHAVDVFRCRSMARFSSAMILPSLLFGGVAFWHLIALQSSVVDLANPWRTVFAVVLLVLGAASAVGFAIRYKRYQRRLCAYLDELCGKQPPSEAPIQKMARNQPG